MTKKALFGKEARLKLLDGINQLDQAVGSTLGPNGQAAIIGNFSQRGQLITKDGVTVAKHFDISDPFAEQGVEMLRHAALSQVEEAGDGTTSTVVLAAQMIRDAQDVIESHGSTIAEIKQEIAQQTPIVIENIKKQAIPVKLEDIEHIATISANNDEVIGKLIGDAYKQIGLNGVISVQESPSVNTTVEVSQGMQFDSGYVAPHFVTDFDKDICVLENPVVLITDEKIQSSRDIENIMIHCARTGKSILIIAQDYDIEALDILKVNKLSGNLKVCAVKAPSFGEYRQEVLEDLAVLLNGQVASYQNHIDISEVTLDMLGQCEKVIVTKDTTTITGGTGSKEAIETRVEQIKRKLADLDDADNAKFLEDFYKTRIAKFTGGIAVIKVGGTTEIEMRERKDRIDDAVCATSAAIEEGITFGGGISLMKACEDDKIGFFFKNACTSIYNRIVTNSNFLDNSWPVFTENDVCAMNGKTGLRVQYLESGIINPVKVDRLVFENAVSILNLYLSTNCIIVDE